LTGAQKGFDRRIDMFVRCCVANSVIMAAVTGTSRAIARTATSCALEAAAS
jgi:hypothetical protein